MVQPSHLIFEEGCSEVSRSRIFDGDKVFNGTYTVEAFETAQQKWSTICAPCSGSSRRNCGYPPIHTDSVMISVDGACRGNGRPGATAACAVFFGPNSPYNEAHVLAADGPTPTSQRAELTGGIKALEAAKRLVDGSLNQVVIKADSAYLVRGATEWVSKWEGRGWKNAKGGEVVNRDLFQQLEDRIRELERKGILVQFFHVSRSWNRQADTAANEALDRAEVPIRSIATPFRADLLPTEREVEGQRRAIRVQPTVLIVSLDSQPWFDEMYSDLINLLHNRAHVQRASEARSALEHLGSNRLAAVLVTDPGITHRKHREVVRRLLQYIMTGGTAVFCCMFSSFIQPSDLNTFFSSEFALSWKYGRYCRTTSRLNLDVAGAVPLQTRLPDVYGSRAVYLKGVKHDAALYLPEDYGYHADTAVAWEVVEDGCVGYIGDVNTEEETNQVILCMCNL